MALRLITNNNEDFIENARTGFFGSTPTTANFRAFRDG